MNRITIQHENYRGTQTDITPESFSGTRIMQPDIEEVIYRSLNESVYQVVVISGNNEILVGEHPAEAEAQEQVDRVWGLMDDHEIHRAVVEARLQEAMS